MGTRRAYYRIVYELQSALSIGAADSIETDSDVALDSRGRPVIPATSLAGVYRSFFPDGEARAYFGERLGGGNGQVALTESVIRVYDAIIEDGSDGRVSVRDSVVLKGKVPVSGLKFDRQIVESGSRFVTYIELVDVDACPTERINEMLGAVHAGLLAFGAKTTRGFGRVEVASVKLRTFDLSDTRSRREWLDFKMFEDAHWSDGAHDPFVLPTPTTSDLTISLELVQRGAVSVREYSTEPGKPDFGQLYIRGREDERGYDVPVIPGTSWAGAFRESYGRYAAPERVEKLFGFAKPKAGGGSEARTSRISFSETVLEDGRWKEVTRNAIDRFTGGTKDGALFTLRMYYAGKASLGMRIALKGESWGADDFAPLIAAIADLHNGFMAIGGLTAVGHGLFQITGASVTVGTASYDSFLRDLTVAPSEDSPACSDVLSMAGKIADMVRGMSEEGEPHE